MSDTQNAWVLRVLGVNVIGSAASSRTTPPTEAIPTGAVAYAKSRLAWLAMRKKLDSEVETFIESVAEQYEDDEQDQEVRELLRARLGPALAVLDDELADKLDDAGNEADAQKRQALVGEARALIQRYQAYVAGEHLFAVMDTNPFATTAIQATVATTLQALSDAIR